MDESRLWRIKTLLFVPKYCPTSADGDLPEQLAFHSRMPEQARDYGDITIAIEKPVDEQIAETLGQNPHVELVSLVADVRAGDDASSAVKKLAPSFEVLVDFMTFDMGAQLELGPMEIRDITPPLSVGEDRAFAHFSAPPIQQYAEAVEIQAIQGRLLGQLPNALVVDDSRTTAVLRWFAKSLGTTRLHDQYIFLWIALEILCDGSEVKVDEPFVCPCGQKIESCPTCGKQTARLVRGKTLKAFLGKFGVTAEQAKRMWEMRQVMHGAIPFDSDKLSDLGSLVQSLRAVVAANLKTRLGKEPTDSPIVFSSGLTVHPAVGLQGSVAIAESDLQPLI